MVTPIRSAFILAALAALAWGVFTPAQHGDFIFDDVQNLNGLERLNSEPTLYSFAQYVFSGHAGPLGRPVALASFAAQFTSWPAHPQDFIRVNILLHLANALLLFWWLLRWRRLQLHEHGDQLVLCMTAALLWLMTPVQANAVFYVVQRMAVFSGTFVLTGLVLHTIGRDWLARGRTLQGYAGMTAAWIVGTGLSGFTKESGVLFPILVLVYETTLLQGLHAPSGFRRWQGAFLKLPTALIFAYLLWIALTTESAPDRPASWERLAIECRLLFLYLGKLLLPSLYGSRLMYDDYLVQIRDSAWLTAVAVVVWAAVLFAAFRGRKRWPLLSFSVLWFWSAHLLESTVIPLEIAFEHRNYVAAVGPYVAVIWGAATALREATFIRIRKFVASAAGAYLAFTTFCMWQTALLWASPPELAFVWHDRQPHSRRALHNAGNWMFVLGRPEEGIRIFQKGLSRWPNDPVLALGYLQFACADASVPMLPLEEVRRRIRHSDGHNLSAVGVLQELVIQAEEGRCPHIASDDLSTLTAATKESPAFAPLERFTRELDYRLARLSGDPVATAQELDRVLAVKKNVPLLQQAIVLALQREDLEGARRYLAVAEDGHSLTARERWTGRLEIQGMRQLIELYEEISNFQPPQADQPKTEADCTGSTTLRNCGPAQAER